MNWLELEDFFKASLEDKVFSRAERKSIRQAVKESNLDDQKRAVLRAKVFDMARAQLNSVQAENILDWLESANKCLLETDEEEEQNARAYFSPGEDCRDAIIAGIRGAYSSIKICVFTISDDGISRELINKHRSGVQVHIATDNDKVYDRGSDIFCLNEAGIAVKVDFTDAHMHHKFAIFDQELLLTGSYNWTRSAFVRNQENIVLLEDEPVVRTYLSEFERLWKTLEPLP